MEEGCNPRLKLIDGLLIGQFHGFGLKRSKLTLKQLQIRSEPRIQRLHRFLCCESRNEILELSEPLHDRFIAD